MAGGPFSFRRTAFELPPIRRKALRPGTAGVFLPGNLWRWVPWLALLLTACQLDEPSATPPRLVLLYAPCTVSKTFLSPYDDSIAFTPRLTQFAEQAMTFERHYTEAGSSGVAYASLFSGFQADRHGVFQQPRDLPADIYLVTEAFADHGYETWVWNAHGMASPRLGYAQGVDESRAFHGPLTASDPSFVALLEDLKANPAKHAFVVTNFSVTHGPYDRATVPAFLRDHPHEAVPVGTKVLGRLMRIYRENLLALAFNYPRTIERVAPLPKRRAQLIDTIELLYKANVWRLDAMFGKVVDAIDAAGLHDESLVVFTADHGEILFREEPVLKWTHSSSSAPEVLSIPLMIRAPGLPGGRYSAVTRSIDVYPTLLGLSDLGSTAAATDGRDLSRAIRGEISPPALSAFSHTAVIPQSVYLQMQEPDGPATWGERMKTYPRPDVALSETVLHRGQHAFKLVNEGDERWQVQAFDVVNDPLETVDRFDPSDSGHARASRELWRYKQTLLESSRALDDAIGLPREEEEAELRALGYIR